jgi:hypothetical protein
VENLDILLLEFCHDMFERHAGKCRSYGEMAKAGLCLFIPSLRGQLVYTSQALKGWRNLVPSKSYPPVTWNVALVIAYALRCRGLEEMAIAVLLSFEDYLRVSELMGLSVSDVMLPQDSRLGVDQQQYSVHLKT